MEMSDGWQDFSSQQTCEAKQIVYQFSDQGAATGPGRKGKLNCQINLENFDNFSTGAHNPDKIMSNSAVYYSYLCPDI